MIIMPKVSRQMQMSVFYKTTRKFRVVMKAYSLFMLNISHYLFKYLLSILMMYMTADLSR